MISEYDWKENLKIYLPREHCPFELSFRDKILREGEVIL
jgi:hypothetical protein